MITMAVLAIFGNISRLSISKAKLSRISGEEMQLLENRKLPEQLKKLEKENGELNKQVEAVDKELTDIEEEMAQFQDDTGGLDEVRERMKTLLEENALLREPLSMHMFYGIYDQTFTEQEETGGAVTDKLFSLIPGMAGIAARSAMSGDTEGRNHVYDLQSARNEVFRDLFYEPFMEANNAMSAYQSELDFYESLLADSESVEERIKSEMLLTSLKDHIAIKEEWDQKKENLIRTLARLQYVTEVCVEVYDGAGLDSDKKDYFLNCMLNQQHSLERALEGQTELAPEDYFADEERTALLIRALDSYQALSEAMSAEYWYGVGVSRSSMMVRGKERNEKVAWARLDENKSRGLIYMEEELGSTHYYDREGRPYKIVTPQGSIYLYKDECISTDLDERQTAAEIEASRWLHDEGGNMDSQNFWRSYYEHTARAALGE